jgi:hypothetical protein
MSRIALSNEERLQIRRYFKNTRPQPRQSDIVNWFEKQFGRRLRQSTISESLSPRFSFLDTLDPFGPLGTDSYRVRAPQWPILDRLLWDWYQLIDQPNGMLSNDIIIQKAREIWPRIPEYAHRQQPNFSLGWLARFKTRHHIKKTIHFDDASLVDLTTAAEEIRTVQKLCGEYTENEILNAFETGLYWKQSPSSSIASRQTPAVKKNYSRTPLMARSNYTGSRRMPPRVISKAQKRHALLESPHHEVRDNSPIQDRMSIQNFLNPAREDTQPAGLYQAGPMEDMIAKYTSMGEGNDEDNESEDDEQTVEIPIPCDHEALEALEILKRYQEHQEQTASGNIQHLHRVQRLILAQIAAPRRKDTLDR